MPTDKKRISVTVDDDMDLMIRAYRHNNAIPSESQAVIELIRKGLTVEDERLHSGGVYSGKEIQLIHVFRRADQKMRDIIMEDLVHSVARNTKKRMYKQISAVGNYDDVVGDVLALIDLYRSASPATRTRVLDLLTEGASESTRDAESVTEAELTKEADEMDRNDKAQ